MKLYVELAIRAGGGGEGGGAIRHLNIKLYILTEGFVDLGFSRESGPGS